MTDEHRVKFRPIFEILDTITVELFSKSYENQLTLGELNTLDALRSQTDRARNLAAELSKAFTNPKQDFGAALALLRRGYRVTREGWNGKGMWLEAQYPDEGSKMTLPYIYMKTADNNLVPWVASQTDILSNDWKLIRGD